MKQNEKSTLINWGEIANFVTKVGKEEKEKNINYCRIAF